MNTSTKIILGLIIAVIVTPVLLAMSLKSKQKNKEFTTGTYRYMRNETTQKGQFGPYKHIQIVGPQDLEVEGDEGNALNCLIYKSDQPGYEYVQYESDDSATVYVQNDTLFVKYVPHIDPTSKEKRRPSEIQVKLHLPTLENISINAASVMVDSAISIENIRLKLMNSGSISTTRLTVKDEVSINGNAIQSKETVLNYEERTTEIPVVQQATTTYAKEVKDVVIFHLM